jgi:hypothetical protein
MAKLLLLPQSSRNTLRPHLVAVKGILRPENESANFHCEEERYSVRTEGVFVFKDLFPNETSCLTQYLLAFVGTNSTSFSFPRRTPYVGCVGSCHNIRTIAAHFKLDQLIQWLHGF